MATLTPTEPTSPIRFDEVALIEEARRVGRRRRRRRGVTALIVLTVAGLIGVGTHHDVTSTTKAGHSSETSASMVSCTRVHVTYLGTDAFPGAAVSAGILVRAALSAGAACRFDGYPSVSVDLKNHSSATAHHLRSGIFGGAPSGRPGAPLPTITITSQPTNVSFTVEWVTGMGGVGASSCPSVTGLRFTMPDSHHPTLVRSIYDGVGNTTFLGVYCRYLSVTPVVSGATGRLHFSQAPPAV